MKLKLPPPPAQYDPRYEAQRNRLIEQALTRMYTSASDVQITSPARLILIDENGHQVEVYVDHAEQVLARHL